MLSIYIYNPNMILIAKYTPIRVFAPWTILNKDNTTLKPLQIYPMLFIWGLKFNS